MRLYVATKEGTIALDVPAEATSRDLTSRVLSSAAADGGPSPSEAARHYLVCDGRKLRDSAGVSGQEASLLAQGVSDGSTLVMFKRRTPPISTDGGQITHPSLEQIERVVRAEAERLGREVVTPAQPSESNRGVAPLETRLHDIMQALHNMSSQGMNDTEMQRHVTQALRTAARLPAGADPMNEEVVVPEPNPTHIAQLGDMGFSSAAARRALLLNRNAVNAAANYLLAHGGDGDIEAEPTEQELRQVYRARNVRLEQPRQVEALPELMEQLTAMGFSDAGSRHALVRNDNNLDSALNLLTSMPPGWEPAPEAAAEQAEGAQAAGEVASGTAAHAGADGASGPVSQGAENEQSESRTSTAQAAAPGLADAATSRAADAGNGQASGSTASQMGASPHASAEPSDGRAGVAALVEAAVRAVQPPAPTSGSEAPLAGVASADMQLDTAGAELLLDGEQRAVVEVRQGGEEGEEEAGDGASAAHVENEGADEDADGEEYQAAQEEFLRRSEQLLDDISMMDLQEGMRGIMSALGGGGGGVVEEGARMSGALPILSTGSSQGGIMDPLRLVDDMRWGNGFSGMLGSLMDDNADGDALDEDDFNDDDGFHTETTYADEEDDPDGDAEEDDDDDEDDDDEAEEDDDGISNGADDSGDLLTLGGTG